MEGADMANGTPHDGSTVEPALIYDAGERRTHAEHAEEAYDSANRANALYSLAERKDSLGKRYRRAADQTMELAKWHATMAIYEALRESKG